MVFLLSVSFQVSVPRVRITDKSYYSLQRFNGYSFFPVILTGGANFDAVLTGQRSVFDLFQFFSMQLVCHYKTIKEREWVK